MLVLAPQRNALLQNKAVKCCSEARPAAEQGVMPS